MAEAKDKSSRRQKSWASDEETGKPPVLSRRVLSHAYELVRPYRHLLILSIVLSVALAGIDLVGPQIIRKILDGPVQHHNIQGIGKLSLLYIGFVILSFVVEAALTLIINWTGQSAMLGMRSRIFRHLQSLDVSFFDHNPVGRLLTRVMNDVNALNEALTTGVPMIFRDVFYLLGIVIILFWTDWRLAMWVFICFPAILIAGWRFSRAVRKYYRMTRARIAALNSFLQENLSGMRIVQIFGQELRMFKKFDNLNARYRDAYMGTVWAFSLIFPAIQMVTAFAISLIIWRGGIRLIDDSITFGVLFSFQIYVQRFFNPIRDLADKYNTVEASLAAAEKIFGLLETPAKIFDVPTPLPLPSFQSALQFDNVSFAYQDEEWVLHNLTFSVERGQTVAIVGATGAGKTTIISLLQRFYDVQQGAILIDGKDIRTLSQQELRRRFAVVLQDVFLFSGTVGDNIRLGRPELNDDEVRKAAETVHANVYIDKFDEGYNHQIQERGATLSVGQKQLLAFARALACQPDILILDEATSNIDTQTEILIQDALDRLLEKRTAIIIAHRLSTIKRADKILVMHHGRLREQGTHEELLRKGGLYWRLCQIQYRDEFSISTDGLQEPA